MAAEHKESNGNGKVMWQVLFWMVTVMLCGFLMSASANDRRIEDKVDCFKDVVAKDIADIKVSIAKIEGAVIKDKP